jgi:hypothetical protein
MAMMKQINLNAGYLIETELRDREAGVNSDCCNSEYSPHDSNSACRGMFYSAVCSHAVP